LNAFIRFVNSAEITDQTKHRSPRRQGIGSSARWIMLKLLVDRAKNPLADLVVHCPGEIITHVTREMQPFA
jgi:hypothetical protein